MNSRIQIIQNKVNYDFNGKGAKLSTFDHPLALDDYDINVIDLSDCSVWRNYGKSIDSIDCIYDLQNINTMIEHSSIIVFIILPQNCEFYCDYGQTNRYIEDYRSVVELKNVIDHVEKSILLNAFILPYLNLKYENTITKIKNIEYKACFWFSSPLDECTKSVRSNKTTTVKWDNTYLTTLKVENYDELITLLDEVNLVKVRSSVPDWLEDLQMFNDEQLMSDIATYKEDILRIQSMIENNIMKLERNDRWKSILYTNGDQLVEVVIEIIEQMLEIDLSEFIDVKDEDFQFEIDSHNIIGEIKGVTSNVKSEHISQVDVHLQSFLDEHGDVTAKPILVINHQRKKSIDSREAVHQKQITLAQRNNCLIIETTTLLKLYENYSFGRIDRNEILKLLLTNNGVLKY